MEESWASAKKGTREFALGDSVDIGADSGQLLRKAPAANLNSNAPLTGIAQYRGMYGSRISTHVDGSVLSSGGPNWMDPPLSYALAAMLESLVVTR
jgi:iron complex outermembrane receptor protein